MDFRAITANDWPAVERIQEACYPPPARENIEHLRCHWLISPQTCFVLGNGAQILGYFLAHPWLRDVLPPLNQAYDSIPVGSDSLFIHDFAILPEARGKGLGDRAVVRVLESETAKRLAFATLISVQGTQAFWARHGFAAVPERTAQFSAALHHFYPGGGCCFMEKTLPAISPV